jgi:hypothetical protein
MRLSFPVETNERIAFAREYTGSNVICRDIARNPYTVNPGRSSKPTFPARCTLLTERLATPLH